MRAGVLPVLIAFLVAGLLADGPAHAKPRRGVFGTINGKAFKAAAGGRCVTGIYDVANTVVVFEAIECKGRRHLPKKNYRTVVLACNNYQHGDTSTMPFELQCPGGSVYTETKTGRFRVPLSQTVWGSNSEILPDFTVTSNLKMRVDAFDGTNIRGAFYGTFEVPLQGNATPPAAVSGEVTFDFPIQVQ